MKYRDTAREHFVAGKITRNEYIKVLKGEYGVSRVKIMSLWGEEDLHPDRAKMKRAKQLLGMSCPLREGV